MSRGMVDSSTPELWLYLNADDLDTTDRLASNLLARIAAGGRMGAGVSVGLGGAGGDVVDGIVSISEVAEQSLAAAFVLWGQRSYIEFLLQSTNAGLRDSQLPSLIAGTAAGATGLSNAMKFLAGLEPLQITASSRAGGYVVDGKMPWVTNLRPQGFHVAAAIDRSDGNGTFVAALSSDDQGLERSEDLALMGMRSSNTAAITLSGVRITTDRIIAEHAAEWLPRVRPAFVGLQCGMSIGLARKALSEAAETAGSGRGVLAVPIAAARDRLAALENALYEGLRTREFVTRAGRLFEIRIELADTVQEAVSLELQALGGKSFMSVPGRDFARRWREAAFIPVITPSLVQLRSALQKARAAA